MPVPERAVVRSPAVRAHRRAPGGELAGDEPGDDAGGETRGGPPSAGALSVHSSA